jgi:hypothetical protein
MVAHHSRKHQTGVDGFHALASHNAMNHSIADEQFHGIAAMRHHINTQAGMMASNAFNRNLHY